jgi:hypothetical protein
MAASLLNGVRHSSNYFDTSRIGAEPAEHHAAHLVAVEEVSRTLIANHVGPGDTEPITWRATMATAQESGKQGLAMFDRSPHCAPLALSLFAIIV